MGQTTSITSQPWSTFTSVDKNDFISNLQTDSTFKNYIIDNLKNNTVLATALKDQMKLDATFAASVTSLLTGNKDFQSTVASNLSKDPAFQDLARGPQGPQGKVGTITESDKGQTIWCADGVCRNTNLLRLRKDADSTDPNDGSISYGTFGYPNTLNIVGGSTNATNRKTRIWGNLDLDGGVISASGMSIPDTRTTNPTPAALRAGGPRSFYELKSCDAIDKPVASGFCTLQNLISWTDDSVPVTQIAYCGDNAFIRKSTSPTAWGGWKSLLFNNDKIALRNGSTGVGRFIQGKIDDPDNTNSSWTQHFIQKL